MYIVTFTAHQQRKIVLPPPQFFWAGDVTEYEYYITHVSSLRMSRSDLDEREFIFRPIQGRDSCRLQRFRPGIISTNDLSRWEMDRSALQLQFNYAR